MRTWLVWAAASSCLAVFATPSQACPPDSQLVMTDQPTGRVESCVLLTESLEQMPTPGRDYSAMLGMAAPDPKSGLVGPYTHWFPNGAVESHGDYVVDGGASVPDGVWGVWYSNGKRKSAGRYQRGQPVGCFASWDAQGVRLTGVVDGDHVRVEPCEPPVDGLADVELRSHPREGRALWGDVALDTLIEGGAFGVKNAMQTDADPSAAALVQLQVRKYLGAFAVGGALAYRMSNTDDARAYAGSAVVAYRLPLRFERFAAEVEGKLGLQYFSLTAQRPGMVGTGDVSFVAPLAGLRLGVSYAIMPTVAIVAGFEVDGSTSYKTDQQIDYCAVICRAPVTETWTVGGAAYGADLGVELRLR